MSLAGAHKTGAFGAIKLAGGYFDTCAVMSTSGVQCWGDNYNGQLGDNSTLSRYFLSTTS